MPNKYLGSRFDDFLAEEGILEECQEIAIKRVLAYQIQQFMQQENWSKTAMATKMQISPATLDRLLNPGGSVTLKTLLKAAQVTRNEIVIQGK
jgi:predicted XRE-type DNA-binding protein